MFKTVGISVFVCMWSAATLEWNSVCRLRYGTHTWIHTRVQWCRLHFKKIENIYLLCMNFCLALPSWRTDGKLAVLKTMERSLSIQGRIICHLCAYLRVTFTSKLTSKVRNTYLLLNCVWLMNFQESLNTCGKGFDTLLLAPFILLFNCNALECSRDT